MGAGSNPVPGTPRCCASRSTQRHRQTLLVSAHARYRDVFFVCLQCFSGQAYCSDECRKRCRRMQLRGSKGTLPAFRSWARVNTGTTAAVSSSLAERGYVTDHGPGGDQLTPVHTSAALLGTRRPKGTPCFIASVSCDGGTLRAKRITDMCGVSFRHYLADARIVVTSNDATLMKPCGLLFKNRAVFCMIVNSSPRSCRCTP